MFKKFSGIQITTILRDSSKMVGKKGPFEQAICHALLTRIAEVNTVVPWQFARTFEQLCCGRTEQMQRKHSHVLKFFLVS